MARFIRAGAWGGQRTEDKKNDFQAGMVAFFGRDSNKPRRPGPKATIGFYPTGSRDGIP
jgi:hypothetical protein